MEQGLFDRMEDFCERSGQSKTVALERALTAYTDAYDKMLKRAKKGKKEQERKQKLL